MTKHLFHIQKMVIIFENPGISCLPLEKKNWNENNDRSSKVMFVILILLWNEYGLCSRQETLENVKKCKNFLITLMKLASSGTRSPDMAQNVRTLVKDLLVWHHILFVVLLLLNCYAAGLRCSVFVFFPFSGWTTGSWGVHWKTLHGAEIIPAAVPGALS